MSWELTHEIWKCPFCLLRPYTFNVPIAARNWTLKCTSGYGYFSKGHEFIINEYWLPAVVNQNTKTEDVK